MRRVSLGSSSEQVSAMCLGTMLFDSSMDRTASYATLDLYIEKGGNFLDTANCYAWWPGTGQFTGDESETLLGQWMQERRNRQNVFLATKVGGRLRDSRLVRDARGEVIWSSVRDHYEWLSPAVIRRSAEESLRRLKTDVIDLYYAHIEDVNTPMDDTLDALHRLVEEGKVRYLGCSNHHCWRLERANALSRAKQQAPYVAIQNAYTYLQPKPGADFGIACNADHELLDYLRHNPDVTLVAHTPLAKNLYDNPKRREGVYLWPLFDSADTRARLAVLEQTAKELGITNSQLVLAWLMHQKPTVIPIVGGSCLEHYRQNLMAAEIHLPDSIVERLNRP